MRPLFYDAPMNTSLSSLFLEDPWMLLLGLLGITILLWAMARRNGEQRLLRGAWIAAMVAILIIVISSLVETTREHLMDQTTQLVDAVERHDTATLDALLMPDARVVDENGNVWFPRIMLDNSLKAFAKRFGQWDHRIISINARQDSASEALSGVKIRTTLSEAEPVPVPSHWEFVWVTDEQGRWRVQDIRAIEIMNQKPSHSLLMP